MGNKANRMEANKSELDELSEKIMKGMKEAARKLVEERAAKDEDMVIGDKDGNFKIVPAKELLKAFSK